MDSGAFASASKIHQRIGAYRVRVNRTALGHWVLLCDVRLTGSKRSYPDFSC